MIECGRHFVGQASEEKQTEELRKQFGMLHRKAKILENKNARFQEEIRNLKKEIETLRVEAEMRKKKLTQMQLANVLGKLEKMKLWMTRTGEAYHAQESRFTKPPHSHSALQYRGLLCQSCEGRVSTYRCDNPLRHVKISMATCCKLKTRTSRNLGSLYRF